MLCQCFRQSVLFSPKHQRGIHFFCREQFIRELLDRRVIQYIVWLDARDVSADGLTKGAVQRALLRQFMDGDVCVHYECEACACKVPLSNSQQQQHPQNNVQQQQQQQRLFLSVMGDDDDDDDADEGDFYAFVAFGSSARSSTAASTQPLSFSVEAMVQGRSTDAKFYRMVPPRDWKPPEGHTPVVLTPCKSKAVSPNAKPPMSQNLLIDLVVTLMLRSKSA
jgi:hypothetical protein